MIKTEDRRAKGMEFTGVENDMLDGCPHLTFRMFPIYYK